MKIMHRDECYPDGEDDRVFEDDAGMNIDLMVRMTE
jgi:hypothetical protein